MTPSRRVCAILIAGSLASASTIQIGSAETWVVAKSDGTCANADDIADLAGSPAFASPFKMAHLGANIEINRGKNSGEIISVTVKLSENENIIYFTDMGTCVEAQRSLHH